MTRHNRGIDGRGKMRWSWKALQETAQLSALSHFCSHDWVFLKAQRNFFISGQDYQDAADQSSCIFWVKQSLLRCVQGRSANAKCISPPNGNCQDTSPLHIYNLSLHFVENVLHWHIFSLSWQLCQLPAGYFPSFASTAPATEAKCSSLCATSWCPDSVLAGIFAAPLLQMGLDKPSKM